jgi:glycosyltransferase involved in cell wall biosynthesis
MKILVDGYNLARPEGTGVATYTRGFIKAAQTLGYDLNILFGLERRKSALEKTLLSDLNAHRGQLPIVWRLRRIAGSALATVGYTARPFRRIEGDEQTDRLPGPATLWNSYGLFAHAIGAFRKTRVFSAVRVPGVDIAHWTYPIPLRAANALNIYTIHDLVPLLRPELTLDNPRRHRRLCEAVVARADHILTVSEDTRSQVISVLGAAPERVTNVYQSHGIHEAEIAAAELAMPAVCKELGLKARDYFLFLGAIEPKKNVPRLLKGYLASGSKTPLILVGAPGWDVSRQLAPLERFGPEQRAQVRLLGYQARATVLALIRGAKATLFPSLVEGFGLPAVESMALGTPVLASRVGGLVEVTGKAAVIIDPLDVSSISAGIRALDSSESLRQSLTAAGYSQAELFSSAAYIQRLETLFAGLRANKGGPAPHR